MSNIPPEVVTDAQAAEREYRPLGPYVSVTVAQWIIESNYGRSMSGKNNPFGIKATAEQIAAGKATVCWTHETVTHADGSQEYVKEPQYFADYESLREAFVAHAALLATSPYYHLAQAAQSPDAYAIALTGIYATGIPGHPYGRALIDIMKEESLYAYDIS